MSIVVEVGRLIETVALVRLRARRGPERALAATLSRVSQGGGVWFVTSAMLGGCGPRGRRAGIDGAVAWASSSLLATALKQAVGRRRPRLRGAGPSTHSSSMPSSHTAGAVAYAVAATLAAPAVGPLVLPLAAGVAWSRLSTGRHFPTDVGVALATGTAAGIGVHLARRRLGTESGGPAVDEGGA